MIRLANKFLTSNNFFIFILVAYIFFLPIQIKFIKIKYLHAFQLSELFFLILMFVTFKKTIFNFIKNFNHTDLIVLIITTSSILSFVIGSKFFYSFADL